MTGFNLPLGCNVSDIPGNRPEDAEWERIIEAFYNKDRLIHPTTGIAVSEKEYAAMDAIFSDNKQSALANLIDAYVSAAIDYGMELGRQEERNLDANLKIEDRVYHEETRNPYLRQYFKSLRERARK